MERERHSVDLPPTSPPCQRGRTDLTDLVISLFIWASLSEPHTYRTAVQNPPDIYIYILWVLCSMHFIIMKVT